MKHRKAKLFKITVALLVLLGMLVTAGCGKKPKKELPMPDITLPSTESTEQTEPEPTREVPQDASLVSLRQAMVETPQVFAVAYLGYPEIIDQDTQTDPFAIMQENAYWLCEDLPFLMDIPQDRIVGEIGELYCIVPKDENATVAVNRGTWVGDSEQLLYEDVIYRSESGEPILLFCNGGGWEADTQVVITDSNGTVTTWYPQLDDNQCAMPLHNENCEDLFFDFSPYREILMAKHRQLKDTQWGMPTAETLAGTTWVWDGFLKDGRETSYRVVFEEDVLSIRWNDGIDEQDHEYLYAPWELTYDEGFAILTIDFGEFAGVLRYNLLYHEFYELLYVAMDAVQEDMPIGWEPLYRYLRKPAAPEPTEMIGTWELAWSEVEGYRMEAESGSATIEITSDETGALWISYTDYAFSDECYTDKELIICPYEMYYGCGNNQWTATVNHTGKFGTEYSVTLLDDGTLLLQRYWELDGAPTVGYGWYYRDY